ncbi:MAG: methyltransferase domain-containing protein [Proteobacteria bacterium]|nr:methyltransferase domain-containing protein [Pseudomonadota bacterium]MBU1714756.1 methyltransferase domain-containing protein [Pseudomonadota bacterium]
MSTDQNWHAGRLFGVSSDYWKSCALHAAVKLEIFSNLGEKHLSPAEISERTACSERGMVVLLNTMVAMGLLSHHDDLYANTSSSLELLDKNSPQYVGHIIMHHHHMVDGWSKLDQAVITGRPVEARSHGEDKERESFLMGMFNLAMGQAPTLAKQVNLDGRRHLLDLGGGPGTYAIHFCMANPGLKATILDLPTTREFAMDTVSKFGMSDRIDFMAGDYHDQIKGQFDAAWLSHIIHSNGPDECEVIINKTVAALKPGGMIMIHDFFLSDTMDGPYFPAIFSLNMLIHNERGRSYSGAEISAMLERAGVMDIHRLPFQAPNDSYVLCGTV